MVKWKKLINVTVSFNVIAIHDLYHSYSTAEINPCLFSEWCSVLSIQDNKVHVCHSRTLQTETRDYVTEEELIVGNDLIWQYKGAPYVVKLQNVFGM